MMIAVAATLTGCALGPVGDTVTTDIGTPAIEENTGQSVPALAQYPPTTIVDYGECPSGSDA